VIKHAEVLNVQRGFEYSAGFIWWFVSLKTGLHLPRYNIYNLVQTESLQQEISLLLKPRLSDYRVAKQYHLLENKEADCEFRTYAKQLLRDQLMTTKPITSGKSTSFQTGAGFSALSETIDLLASFDIDAFPISGTLLGLVREGGLLEHDYDIDIGVFAAKTDTLQLLNCLSKNSRFIAVYELQHMVQATHENGTVIDIFLHYEENGKCWHGTDIHRWYNTLFELESATYQGRTFLTPGKPERYLEENYGDWRRRPLFWDYSFDTPNQQFANTRKAVYFLLDRVLEEMEKSQPDRYRVEKGLEALSSQFSVDLH